MTQNIIFILTEGEHDAAFIYRILKANDIKKNHIAIKDYPFPLNEVFKSGISSISIEEMKIGDTRSKFLPSRVMQKDSSIISIYALGGDLQEQRRIEFIHDVNALNTHQADTYQVAEDIKISILFFFDADNKGINYRIKQVKKELGQSFSGIDIPENFNNKEIYTIGNIKTGTFVFTEPEKESGMLEDVLIPLMKEGNEDIFNKADAFLEIHESTALFKGKVKYKDNIKKEINGKKYDPKKSLIGTVGQLQLSGKSNTVCISDSDYLTDDKIRNNPACTDIYTFIQKVL
ncbi:hypothetical protein Barb4_02220 [Bacteroidales bacterium Barb4]|nr:hypothetical protein Barb4_02220 [Bacteroidales bacterium Barb4]